MKLQSTFFNLTIQFFYLFNILLVRSWIHAMGVVSSTLHCMITFLYNNKLYTIEVDPNLESCLQEKVVYQPPISKSLSNLILSSTKANPLFLVANNIDDQNGALPLSLMFCLHNLFLQSILNLLIQLLLW